MSGEGGHREVCRGARLKLPGEVGVHGREIGKGGIPMKGGPVRTVAELEADPENRRAHPARNLEMIAAALREVGAARSIVIDEDDRILAGNGVTTAAAQAGITKLKIIEAEGDELIAVRRRGLTPEQKRALAIYDNRTGELAEWNVEQLEADRDAGLALEPFWSTLEQGALFGTVPKSGQTDPDAVPALRSTSIRLGALFALGPHRLLCGDCTEAAAVARVLEAPAALAFTSPPYADQRAYGGAQPGAPAALAEFLPACAGRVALIAIDLGFVRRAGAIVRYWDAYIAAAEAAGLALVSWNVWNQGVQGSPGKLSALFPIAHEFIFVFAAAGEKRAALNRTVRNKSGGELRPPGDRQTDGSVKQKRPVRVHQFGRLGTVLDLSSEQSRSGPEKDHPARFPVALPLAYIAATTAPGEAVYDPFLGSGSTLIACEQLERHGAGIELEPRYCQMAIDRWEAFTGQTATKLGELGATPRGSRRRHARP